ncbi:hypothetical protein PsYK624_155720 [Phanerochaete sordida]|uniref:Uncharacterized protein n=1 Tax=Phanerochaete sordida TaxID=48140 RepID=A0A9P3GP43_9APHY|nr:hypothetical protein PsYK624_155720 [Phanerochaete sordida]
MQDNIHYLSPGSIGEIEVGLSFRLSLRFRLPFIRPATAYRSASVSGRIRFPRSATRSSAGQMYSVSPLLAQCRRTLASFHSFRTACLGVTSDAFDHGSCSKSTST